MKNFKLFFVLFLLIISSLSSYAKNVSENYAPVNFEKIQYVSAGHILVNSYDEAVALKKRIDNGEVFEALAKQYSKCPSAQRGGALGMFGRGQMERSFENAAFNLQRGQVSEPIKTIYGWHLIKVYDRK